MAEKSSASLTGEKVKSPAGRAAVGGAMVGEESSCSSTNSPESSWGSPGLVGGVSPWRGLIDVTRGSRSAAGRPAWSQQLASGPR